MGGQNRLLKIQINHVTWNKRGTPELASWPSRGVEAVLLSLRSIVPSAAGRSSGLPVTKDSGGRFSWTPLQAE